VAGSGAFASAGAKAGEEARGPGSFVAAMIDHLYLLDAAALSSRVRPASAK
jgi:hydroxyethylthiazole kinase-like sugar kinase family protein